MLFTMNDEKVMGRFNSFGQKVFDCMAQGAGMQEVKEFIETQVIKGEDSLKEKRAAFLKDMVLPGNGKTASENIYRELERELC